MCEAPASSISWSGKSNSAQSSSASCASCSEANVFRSSRRRCRRAPAYPSRRCRCSRPALHEHLDRPLTLLVPEDADARDLAEAAGWFLGPERVALLPSRGVRWDSGLQPPPHLVGERARALDVLASGGLVVRLGHGPRRRHASRGHASRADPHRPRRARRGSRSLTESLALAGYERVERAEDRGQFAVRGGLVDVFPTTGREPLRIEFFGDEIEQMRAYSAFTQRALHPVDEAIVYAAAERRLDLVEPTLRDDDNEPPTLPRDLVSALPRGVDVVWEIAEVRNVWEEEGLEPIGLRDSDRAPSSSPPASRSRSRRSGPRSPARGLSEAENELTAFVRAGHRVVVAFPHRGEALRTENLMRRVDAPVLEPGEILPDDPAVRFAISPARRGFVWRDLNLVLLLPDTQVFRKRAPRADATRVGRALQSFADLRTGDYVVHEDHGVGKLIGFETKTVAGVTRDYLFLAFRGDDRLYVPHEQIGKVSRYIGVDAKSPALSKLGGKAWQNSEDARARVGARAGRRADRAVRAAPAGVRASRTT